MRLFLLTVPKSLLLKDHSSKLLSRKLWNNVIKNDKEDG